MTPPPDAQIMTSPSDDCRAAQEEWKRLRIGAEAARRCGDVKSEAHSQLEAPRTAEGKGPLDFLELCGLS